MDKKQSLIVAIVAVLALVALSLSIFMTTRSTAETHRELKDVPPKGAGKYDRK